MCLGLLASGQLHANPELADEQSLSNGAQLYALYCSDCHGRVHGARSDALYGTDKPADYTELIDIALERSAPAPTAAPEEEWPEWADPLDPDEVEVTEADVRAEVLGVVTAAIDEAHGVNSASDRSEMTGGSAKNSAENSAEIHKKGGFYPMPGATDLSAPQTFFYGTSEDELFTSIATGTGAAMPGWRAELGSDAAIWDMVNYIRSFWGEEWLY